MAASMDLLTNKFLEIINQLQNTLSAHGQEAVNLALASIQVDAAGYLLTAFAALFFALFVYKLKNFVFVKNWSDDEFLVGRLVCYVIFLCIPGAIAFTWGAIEIFNVWNYAALVNPKLYLAHTVVESLLNTK